jgi:hypothetical protein
VNFLSLAVSTSKRDKRAVKKSIGFDKERLEKGDPDFTDERKSPHEPKAKKSFLNTLF